MIRTRNLRQRNGTPISDRQMAALLTKPWDRSLVSLTDAVYWISTNGELREPDDDDLEAAANLLISDLQAGELAALGIPAGEGQADSD
jgi:hypothetical protein